MIHQQDYTAYQTYALLDFNISFEKDVPADDISRAVIEVTERIDINKFVDFTHRNSHGYDGLMMLRLLLLAFADNGYASTRKLAELCRTDIRYMFIAQNQKPSHQAFQRFIHDDLIMSVEDIFYEMNRIMEDELPIDTDVLCIDGTKYEANANKNTFIWRKEHCQT
ncbi:transposase [Catenibacterium sp.]|uniref:transposase n=1 Tax=Catenibacterium sp. TaxID=2049022 RepID=UPI0039910DD0